MQSQKLNGFGVRFNASSTWHFDRKKAIVNPKLGFQMEENYSLAQKKWRRIIMLRRG